MGGVLFLKGKKSGRPENHLRDFQTAEETAIWD